MTLSKLLDNKSPTQGKRGEWGTRISGRYGDLVGADGAAGAR
jgi:hypothetical protein